MKTKTFLRSFVIVFTLSLGIGCMRDNVDESDPMSEESSNRTLESLVTRTSAYDDADSLTIMSRQQADLDNFMMSRVIYKTDKYELCLKQEDAAFFGVSDDLYNEYVLYVEKLNEMPK